MVLVDTLVSIDARVSSIEIKSMLLRVAHHSN